MSEDTTFWVLIICIILGAILIFNWIVPGIKIAAVGIIPFTVGIIALYLHHKRTCPRETEDESEE